MSEAHWEVHAASSAASSQASFGLRSGARGEQVMARVRALMQGGVRLAAEKRLGSGATRTTGGGICAAARGRMKEAARTEKRAFMITVIVLDGAVNS